MLFVQMPLCQTCLDAPVVAVTALTSQRTLIFQSIPIGPKEPNFYLLLLLQALHSTWTDLRQRDGIQNSRDTLHCIHYQSALLGDDKHQAQSAHASTTVLSSTERQCADETPHVGNEGLTIFKEVLA